MVHWGVPYAEEGARYGAEDVFFLGGILRGSWVQGAYENSSV